MYRMACPFRQRCKGSFRVEHRIKGQKRRRRSSPEPRVAQRTLGLGGHTPTPSTPNGVRQSRVHKTPLGLNNVCVIRPQVTQGALRDPGLWTGTPSSGDAALGLDAGMHDRALKGQLMRYIADVRHLTFVNGVGPIGRPIVTDCFRCETPVTYTHGLRLRDLDALGRLTLQFGRSLANPPRIDRMLRAAYSKMFSCGRISPPFGFRNRRLCLRLISCWRRESFPVWMSTKGVS